MNFDVQIWANDLTANPDSADLWGNKDTKQRKLSSIISWAERGSKVNKVLLWLQQVEGWRVAC